MVPLGFGARQLPSGRTSQTPFKKLFSACSRALADTEPVAVNRGVLMKPQIPVMTRIQGNPTTHKIGHAQEANIIK